MLPRKILSACLTTLLMTPSLIAQNHAPASPPTGAAAKTAAGAPAPSRMTEADFVAALESHLGRLSAADEFSGTVLVAKDGKPIFHKAYGLASREYDTPNRTDTKFNLGSINKIFTQVAIGQLAEQGRLSLDDKLGKHLPDYPNRNAAEKVTVRHLLTMSSGIGDVFGPKYDATPKDKLRAVRDYLPLFSAEPLAFEPGTSRQYSNGGYVVLGAIIEKVSGQDYYDYVREHVFKPAGMRDTDWYEADMPAENLASGYTRRGAESGGAKARVNNLYTRPAKGSPAGGGYSTAEDLLKFTLAVRAGKLRVPDFRRAEGARKVQGAAAQDTRGGNGVGIAGGAPGINAVLEADVASGYTTVVMSNYDPPSASAVGKQIREWLARVGN